MSKQEFKENESKYVIETGKQIAELLMTFMLQNGVPVSGIVQLVDGVDADNVNDILNGDPSDLHVNTLLELMYRVGYELKFELR